MKHTQKTAEALEFATRVHMGQTRKYTGDSYIVHPIAVAELVWEAKGTENMVCAAFLHDTIEDGGVHADEIVEKFGREVASFTWWMTDRTTLLDGNRKTRKRIERERWNFAPVGAKTIKLADLLDNTRDIIQNDKVFGKVYFEEAWDLMDYALLGVNQELEDKLYNQLMELEKQLY